MEAAKIGPDLTRHSQAERNLFCCYSNLSSDNIFLRVQV